MSKVVRFIKESAKKFGFSVVFSKKQLRGCLGFFDDSNKKIVCYENGDNFDEILPVLVHEYSHMLQYVYCKKYWEEYQGNKKRLDSVIEKMFDIENRENILVSKKFDNGEIKTAVCRLMRMEKECESITVFLLAELIAKFPQEFKGFDICRYKKEFNLYLAKCAFFIEKKIWVVFSDGLDDEEFELAIAQMPGELPRNIPTKANDRVKKIFEKIILKHEKQKNKIG
jgi:hypothetical protein